MISSASVLAQRDLAVGFGVCLDVLLHGEGDVCVSDPMAQCLPVDLRIAASRGVAVPHIGSGPGLRSRIPEPFGTV